MERLAKVRGELLREVFSAAVREQLETRQRLIHSGGSISYLRAPAGLTSQMVDLEPGLLEQVRAVKELDKVSVRSILFNALTEYAKRHPVS